MKTFWIIGGGRFGLRAAKSLGRMNAVSRIVIVEKRPEVCEQLTKHAFENICMEGVRYLELNLTRQDCPDWIIPAIPSHVAYEWIKTKLSKKYNIEPIPIPQQLRSELPNPITANSEQVYISNADFVCPDDCPEPEDICTYTGEPRPSELYSLLASIQHGRFRSVVVRSQQLLPGVGGYEPGALFKAMAKIELLRSPVLLSTACRCHGVMNAFRIRS